MQILRQDLAGPRRGRAGVGGRTGERPDAQAGREGLAYVIYTSGSTGAPKRVMIRYGGLASYVLAARRDFALTPSDRMLQFASLLRRQRRGDLLLPGERRGSDPQKRRDARRGPRCASSPSAGRCRGARAYVLDGAGELCPPGIPGELAIGGLSLVRGYLGRPDLTARAFLPDPFAGRSGARMYTTGDLVRHRLGEGEDGALEYLGRIDRQVKVRGFRIELAEIEGALAQHPAVAEAAVGVDERRAGERALVAWWAARPGQGATAAELRGFLKERLPEPMVPSLFARLPALPRNASGKLDRRALPVPKLEATSAGGYEAPATPAEETVAYVWREVLGVPRVGRQDDFYALGGRSLLLLRVRHLLEQELGVRLSLASLLERTTAAALALAAEELLLDELERELAAAR
ncbi:MAG TPA: AMP-binding protein [Thermoanaerobaculia bacterium]|nr:AMP-binding protein [Thermoanaerobaculia bacterium]